MVAQRLWVICAYFALLGSVLPTRSEADVWLNIDIYIHAVVLLSAFVVRNWSRM